MKKEIKIREKKKKKEPEGGRWDASIHSVLPSSSILLPSRQNEGLISAKHFNTTCPQTELTV